MKKLFLFVILFAFMRAIFPLSPSEIYKNNCEMCHGPTGAGNGPVGTALRLSSFKFEPYKTENELKKYILDILEKGKPGTVMESYEKKIPEKKDREELADFLAKKYHNVR